MVELPPAVLLMGPTASGKTPLALTLAREFPMEIVSVDSAQVYRGMDIGTAKPSPAERGSVPHHLLDVIHPTESYSAARFCADALRVMAEITARGRIPLLAGGTMLYFRALQKGLSSLPGADQNIRAEIDREAAARGWPAMHRELEKIDPQTAARLKPGDAQRIQRALEVFRASGEPMSGLLGRKKDAPFPFRPIGIVLLPSNRGALHQRIERRFDAMLERGLVDELRSLKKRYGLEPALPSMRCVGYRQAWQHLDEEIDEEELRNRGIFATRQLAKRQLTWLRATKDARAFDCLAGDLDVEVQRALRRELKKA